MGFEIHSEENPDYFAKLSVWEWSRFLDLLLFRIRAINKETMLNNIVHISLLETQALTQEKTPKEWETFDITEHKIELQVNRDDDYEVNKMEILDTDLPDGRKLFHGAALHLTKDIPERGKHTRRDGNRLYRCIPTHGGQDVCSKRKVPCFENSDDGRS